MWPETSRPVWQTSHTKPVLKRWIDEGPGHQVTRLNGFKKTFGEDKNNKKEKRKSQVVRSGVNRNVRYISQLE